MLSLTPYFAAAIASIPGLAVSYYLVSGRNTTSFEHVLAGFLSVAAWLLPIYVVGAFVYGFVLSMGLRVLGWVSLPGFLLGAVVPVVLFLVVDVLIRGYSPGTHIALVAFGLPCLVMGFTLWLFTVRGSLGA
jgi:hypothetical protein